MTIKHAALIKKNLKLNDELDKHIYETCLRIVLECNLVPDTIPDPVAWLSVNTVYKLYKKRERVGSTSFNDSPQS